MEKADGSLLESANPGAVYYETEGKLIKSEKPKRWKSQRNLLKAWMKAYVNSDKTTLAVHLPKDRKTCTKSKNRLQK